MNLVKLPASLLQGEFHRCIIPIENARECIPIDFHAVQCLQYIVVHFGWFSAVSNLPVKIIYNFCQERILYERLAWLVRLTRR